MRKILQAWHVICRHKYLVTIADFLLIIGVLDENNNLMKRYSHWREIQKLKEEIEYYRRQYEEDSRLLKEISSNPEELEKVAREKYLMKKPDEDVYVFEEELEENE